MGCSLSEIAKVTGLRLRSLQRFWKGFAEANEPCKQPSGTGSKTRQISYFSV